MTWILLLLCHLAAAGQTRFESVAGPREQVFRYGWVDGAGVRYSAEFSLPTAAVARAAAEPLRLPVARLAAAQVAAVKAYASTVDGPKLTAKAAPGGSVRMSVSGRDRARMRAALDGAQAAADEARRVFLDRHRWIEDARGRLRADHARVVAEDAALVAPVAEALGMMGVDPRVGLAKALSFVQSIRYEKRARRASDAGFRAPLSLLAANRGDCDGKATLFLALARAAYPELPLAVAYIPGHAFVGVGLPPEKGEHTFREDGQRYVLVEPVGPAPSPIGEGMGRSERRAALGLVDVVSVR